ncbi:MAG: hypothetical protein AB7E55_32760 [Pigmentiphaga sp.]
MNLSPVETLQDTHSLDQFSCGKPALDDWLKSYAKASQRNDFTRVMVVHDDNRIAGYYGLALSAIDATAAPRRIRTGRPPDPIACLLIGPLAVDQHYHGRGAVLPAPRSSAAVQWSCARSTVRRNSIGRTGALFRLATTRPC